MNAPSHSRAFGGLWRLTSRQFARPTLLLCIAAVIAIHTLLAGVVTLRGDASAFVEWTTGFYLSFLAPMLAFLSGAGAMRDEMRSESVDYVLTRPIRRPALLAFKYVSHAACTQPLYLVALAGLLAVGIFRGIPGLAAALPSLLVAQVLVVVAFSAFGFLCAVVTSRYIVLGLVYGALVEAGLGNIPTQVSRLSMTHHVRTLLDGARLAIRPEDLIKNQGSPFIAAGVLVLFAAVALAISAAVFSQREFAGVRASEG